MSINTRLTHLLGIRYPIIQAGMSWASSCAALPAAVSNAGGLGVIAAGPMRLADLASTLRQVRELTDKPFAVNIPLYRKGAEEVLDLLVAEQIPVIIASQGSPKAHLQRFKDYGATWLHVVAFVEHARKAAAAGVDGLVVVGSEAGGHPPANEVSTLVNVRRVLQEVDCPLVAGGGVADGYGIAALLALGAEAVQLGTRFMLSEEANLHPAYKQKVLDADIADTVLVGRGSLPVRSVRNAFTDRVALAERDGMPRVAPDDYAALLASASLKQASFDGDVNNGKVEAGQSAGLIHQILPAAAIMQSLIEELEQAFARLRAMQP
ncbi:NAD(P)H-dependent flavin oxidoreductase [Pseudomonas sp. BF-R-01]|jgi:enoyl-[acyl-carrier protein] reductase II|uniref:NAD(P)H-dependent flavin oxidoreductase n=1 Tax=Pseudomonas sp. BF-R-01 TaxID=2832365 RepID=UPI001CBF0D51|nr:nitronate monooxygenase [Pseudomonas sp. BF-R-01]